jgi:YaiO family outer membrane protein
MHYRKLPGIILILCFLFTINNVGYCQKKQDHKVDSTSHYDTTRPANKTNKPIADTTSNQPLNQPTLQPDTSKLSQQTNQPTITQPDNKQNDLRTNQPTTNQPVTPVNPPGREVGPLDSTTSDGLLILARKAAFDEKNYPKAKNYLHRALALSPDYADLLIFLGRIHAWTGQYDSAKINLDRALKLKPDYEDAAVAYADLEYWNDHYKNALSIINQALIYHPDSHDLLMRKAKVYRAMKDYKNAMKAVNEALKNSPNSIEAKELKKKIEEEGVMNAISFSYDFSYFDRQYNAPWHIFSLDYSRKTPIGSVIGRFNFANRFNTNGTQIEFDAYPKISKSFYAYLNVGWGLTETVFPRFRAGFSLYANLPAGFEGELGLRYLKFTNDVLIYTAYIGKYYRNWLFGEKFYFVPSDYSATISASITLSATYYIGGESRDNIIGGYVGFGVSPDDRGINVIQLEGVQRLSSFKVGTFYKKKFARFWVLSLSQGFVRTEYLPGVRGNEYQFGMGFLRRF